MSKGKPMDPYKTEQHIEELHQAISSLRKEITAVMMVQIAQEDARTVFLEYFLGYLKTTKGLAESIREQQKHLLSQA